MTFLFAASVYAHGPTRQKVSESIEIEAPAEKVWGIVGAYDQLHTWLPPVSKTELIEGDPNKPGALRVVTVGDKSVTEKLKAYKPEKMSLKYRITKGDITLLPVTNYQSTITVKSLGTGKSEVTWAGAFYRGDPNNNPPENLNDDAAIAAVTGLYKVGLENLKKIAEQ